jgi:hypothetical protein
MAWGTTAKAEIYFDRQTYNTKDEVYSRMDDVEDQIKFVESKIGMLIAGNPRELLNTKDCEGYDLDTVDVVVRQSDEILEWYRDLIVEKYKLGLLLDSFDTRDGEFVKKEPKIPCDPGMPFDSLP